MRAARRLAAGRPLGSTERNYRNQAIARNPIFGRAVRASADFSRATELLEWHKAVAAGRARRWWLAGGGRGTLPEVAAQPESGGGDDGEGDEVLHHVEWRPAGGCYQPSAVPA